MLHLKKRILCAILMASLTATFSAPYVYATETTENAQQEAPQKEKGSTLIAVSASNLKVGETLTVTIRGSNSSTLNLKFNPDVLTYKSSGQSVSLNGNVITYNGKEAAVTFEATGAGSSGLILSGEGLEGCSTIIQVAEAPEESEEKTEETEETEDVTEETETTGESTEEGSDTTDSKKNKKKKHSTTFGSAERYVSIMSPDSIPTFMLESKELETDEGTFVDAYQLINGGNEFYYLYGTDEKDNLGWFIYDSSEKTISRIDPTIFASVKAGDEGTAKTETKENTGFDLDKIISDRRVWAVLIFVCAVLIAIIINVLLRNRGKKEEEEQEESDSGVSSVYSNSDTKKEGVLDDDFVSKKGAVWDTEEEHTDSKYNLAEEVKNSPELPETHDIIGEKRVDIMDLNDL
ncbi:MAG: cohesin domain-containing protein [Lachnospiraceae bacterium]|nr:cohesin domain-containing protein [Lachnospiraceae bacterium]